MGRFSKLTEQLPKMVEKSGELMPEVGDKLVGKIQQQAGRQLIESIGLNRPDINPLPMLGEGIKNTWNSIQDPREEALKALAEQMDFQQGTTGIPNKDFQEHARLALDLATPDITNLLGSAGSALKIASKSGKVTSKIAPKALESMSAAQKAASIAEHNPELLTELAKSTSEKLQTSPSTRFGRLIHQTSTPLERQAAKQELVTLAEQAEKPTNNPVFNSNIDEYTTQLLNEASLPVTSKRIVEAYHANPAIKPKVESMIGREATDASKKVELQRIKDTLEEQRQTAINALQYLKEIKGF